MFEFREGNLVLYKYFHCGTGDDMIMCNPLQGCNSRCSSSCWSYGSWHV